MRNTLLATFVAAMLLGACGGAGSPGGPAPTTYVPAGAQQSDDVNKSYPSPGASGTPAAGYTY